MRKECDTNKLSDVKMRYISSYLEGNVILDVGAGYAYYSTWLATKNPNLKIVALDKLELESCRGVEFLCVDLENPIPLPDNVFNTILAFDIIEHISNEELLVKELYRLCKPNGTIIGSVPHNDDKFLPAYNLTFYHRSDLTHKRYYIPETLRESLEKVGFQIINVTPQGIVSPQVFAEFFPQGMHFLVKKGIGLLRRLYIINAHKLASDLFFVARKI